MEESGTVGDNHNGHVNSITSTTTSPQRSAQIPSSPSSSRNHAVHPATVPLRTSSVLYSLSPKKRQSLNSVSEERPGRYSTKLPEVDERNWLSQGRDCRDMVDRLPQTLESASSQPVQAVDMIGQYNPSWSSEKENILKGPFEYIESHPGKDIRSQLIAAFNAWLQVPAASLAIITRVVGMLHTASLLVDDVEDDSKLRRGVPVAHSIFGTAQTINSANYIYFCALQELLKLNNPEVIQVYTEELLNLHRGQGMDLFWRDTLTCPSEDDYLEMVGNKTGGLFRLAIKLMCAESPSHHSPSSLISQPASNDPSSSSSDSPRPLQIPDYIPLVNTIGLLFQILDDYLNLSSDVYTTNKGLCEDLTEGKFSFPIIHAIRSEPQNLVLINILKQKPRDDDVKRYAVAFMERCGSFAYTRRILRGLLKKAQNLVEEVDGGRSKADGMREILEKLRVDRLSSGGGGGKSAVGRKESVRAG
nr:geranylgeranyl pyrophosphate synthase [Quercus suber]